MVRLTSTGARPTEGSSMRMMRGASISARERKHLLLAAAHGAGKLPPPLGEARKAFEAEIQIGFERSPCLLAKSSEQQVFFHGQAGEQPAALRHEGNAEIDDLLGGTANEVMGDAVDLGHDTAGARAQDAHYAFHER